MRRNFEKKENMLLTIKLLVRFKLRGSYVYQKPQAVKPDLCSTLQVMQPKGPSLAIKLSFFSDENKPSKVSLHSNSYHSTFSAGRSSENIDKSSAQSATSSVMVKKSHGEPQQPAGSI